MKRYDCKHCCNIHLLHLVRKFFSFWWKNGCRDVTALWKIELNQSSQLLFVLSKSTMYISDFSSLVSLAINFYQVFKNNVISCAVFRCCHLSLSLSLSHFSSLVSLAILLWSFWRTVESIALPNTCTWAWCKPPVSTAKHSLTLSLHGKATQMWPLKRGVDTKWKTHLFQLLVQLRPNVKFKVYFVLLQRLFSSPEHKVLKVSFCDGPLSVVHRPCVNNFFKQHLLWNHFMDFDQTSQEWSLGGPLSKLFKPFQLVA